MVITDLFNKFHKQISNLSIYFLAALIPTILSLVSNPFLSKNLSPEDYAITGYYAAFNSLFGPLVNFYLLHYYTKRFYELNEEERMRLKATLFRALIFFSLGLSLLVILVLLLYMCVFNSNTQIPILPYIILSTMALPVTGIYSLSLVEFRMKRESKKFFHLSVSNGLLGIALALLFVVAFKWGAIGKMSAALISATLVFLYVLYHDRDIWRYPFDKNTFVEAVKFCWPLVIASMLTFFCSGYDKVFLERQGDLHTLGVYSVGVSIATYLSVFSTSINDTFQPDIFESVVKRNFRRCFKFIVMKLSIMSLCVIAFIALAPFIIRILTYGRYVDSTPFASIVALSSITSMLYYSMSQVTVALGLTKITLTNKIIGSIASVLSFHLLISYFGAIGAAWGVVLSYFYLFAGNTLLVVVNYKNHKK